MSSILNVNRSTFGWVFVALLVLFHCNTAGIADDRHQSKCQTSGLTNSPLNEPDFFPIGVWLQAPKNAWKYKEAGINLYIGLWKGPTGQQLEQLKRADMHVIAAQNELALNHPDRDIIAGWMLPDEPDNAQKRDGGWGYGPPIAPGKLIIDYQETRKRDATRPVFLNLGQGVAWDDWRGRGIRSNHPEDYPEYVNAADIVSFDIYPVTHSNRAVAGKLEYIAKGVRRLRRWSTNCQKVWNIIGASRINNEKVKPTAEQIRSQVWISLVSGSQGIIYFVHQFAPGFVEASLFDDPELLQAVRTVNQQVRSLAPVLNSENVDGIVEVVGADNKNSVAIMVKRHLGKTYLFSVSLVGKPITVDFELSERIANSPVVAVNENRPIETPGATLRDRFAPYGVHIYRFDRPCIGQDC